MTEKQNQFKIPKEIRNSVVIGLISLFSTLAVGNGIPTLEKFYMASITAFLVCLTEYANTLGMLEKVKKITKTGNKGSSSSFFF